MLESRTAPRSAEAATRVAVSFVNEGIISERNALMRVNPSFLRNHSSFTIDRTLGNTSMNTHAHIMSYCVLLQCEKVDFRYATICSGQVCLGPMVLQLAIWLSIVSRSSSNLRNLNHRFCIKSTRCLMTCLITR